MSDSPLIAHVHPDVIYRRIPLADAENGLALLRAANEAVVNEDDEIGHVFYAEEDCECGLADCLACNYDYATVLKKTANVIAKNSRCLGLYAQVLAKGRVQFPAPRSGSWFGGSPSDLCYQIDQLKALQMHLAGESGDVAGAARFVCERAQLAAIIGRGEGTLGRFIHAIGILRAALRNAVRLVEKPEVTPEALAELARIEPYVLDADDLAQTTRADFLITLDSIEAIERLPTSSERIDYLLDHFYLQQPFLDELESWDDEGRLVERRRQMHVVLDGHPHAWDAAETLRRLSSQAARHMKLDWHDVEAEDDCTSAFWQHLPPQLQPYFSIEWLGNSASAAAARERDRELDLEIGDELSSDADLAAAREAIRAIANPIGLILENALQPTDIRDICRECQELGWSLGEKIRERRESR